MFRLIKDSNDVVRHTKEVWVVEGNTRYHRPDTDVHVPYRYPCLEAVVLTYNYGSVPRFAYIYCYKTEAKRLVYPSTNKCRGANSFRFVENKNTLWELINVDLRPADMEIDRVQTRILDKVHRICNMNEAFPVLYTYINTTTARKTRLFRPIVLPLYTAKKLIYYKPPKKSKMVIAPSLSQEITQTQPTVIVQRQAVPIRNIYRGHMVINLSASTPGIIRFVQAVESDFVFREQHELDNMNIEMNGDLENVRDNDKRNYISRTLRAFTDWRKAQRRTNARRFPQEVLRDSVNQSLLKRAMLG